MYKSLCLFNHSPMSSGVVFFYLKKEDIRTMLFSDRLFKTVEPVWNSYLEHPFVKGIGEGTLDKEKFIHYMKQDYVYLIEYSRVFAIGSTKANDLRSEEHTSELQSR